MRRLVRFRPQSVSTHPGVPATCILKRFSSSSNSRSVVRSVLLVLFSTVEVARPKFFLKPDLPRVTRKGIIVLLAAKLQAEVQWSKRRGLVLPAHSVLSGSEERVKVVVGGVCVLRRNKAKSSRRWRAAVTSRVWGGAKEWRGDEQSNDERRKGAKVRI